MRQIMVWLDEKRRKLPQITNGAAILAAARTDGTRHLYQEAAGQHDFDLPIDVLDRVILKTGFCFYTIPASGPHGADEENDAGLKERAQPFTPRVRTIGGRADG